jgi:excisionase family DNA binding protein
MICHALATLPAPTCWGHFLNTENETVLAELVDQLRRMVDLLQTSNAAAAEKLPRLAYSIDETAYVLGVSRRQIEGLIDSGKLGAEFVGRTLRVPVAEVQEYLARATNRRRRNCG